jgi:hypothetical protein
MLPRALLSNVRPRSSCRPTALHPTRAWSGCNLPYFACDNLNLMPIAENWQVHLLQRAHFAQCRSAACVASYVHQSRQHKHRISIVRLAPATTHAKTNPLHPADTLQRSSVSFVTIAGAIAEQHRAGCNLLEISVHGGVHSCTHCFGGMWRKVWKR